VQILFLQGIIKCGRKRRGETSAICHRLLSDVSDGCVCFCTQQCVTALCYVMEEEEEWEVGTFQKVFNTHQQHVTPFSPHFTEHVNTYGTFG